MNILEELTALLVPIIPVETGVFSGTAPDKYCVLTPIAEMFPTNADDFPTADMQSVRISIYTQGNYIHIKNLIVKSLLLAGFTITARQYIDHEDDTGYYHFAVDVEKIYSVNTIMEVN